MLSSSQSARIATGFRLLFWAGAIDPVNDPAVCDATVSSPVQDQLLVPFFFAAYGFSLYLPPHRKSSYPDITQRHR